MEATTPNSTSKVVEMLSTELNPLVGIAFLPQNYIRGMSLQFGRSMGFVTEKFRRRLRLVTTCRHIFINHGQGHDLVLTMNNPKTTRLKLVGGPIFDSNPEYDIAFLIVKDVENSPTQPLIVDGFDIPFSGSRTLYNVRNQSNFTSSASDFFVARQQVVDKEEWAYAKVSDPSILHVAFSDKEEQERQLQEGYTRCRSFAMMSRPGFSGSPIWDDDLRLYGMDIRGSEPGTEFHRSFGDITICMPNSEIFAARQRADREIQRILDSQ